MNHEEKQQNYDLAERLLSEQNFAAAVVAGAVATVLAAAIYGVITAITGFAYSFTAAGIGVVIGLTMQFIGRGIAMKFALVAGIYAFAGCMLGNLFTAVMQVARASGNSPIDVLLDSSGPALADWLMHGVGFVDLVFWMVAVGCAVFFVKRPLSRREGLAIHTYSLKG